MNQTDGDARGTPDGGGQRRRLLLALAGVAVVAAASLGVFAILVWGGSSGTAAKASHVVVDRAALNDLPVTPLLTPSPTPVPTPIAAPLKGAPFHLVIDKIGVNAPVVPEGLDSNQVPVVPLDSYEVAWYTFSAQPGTGGNAVFAGHVTWGGEAVFYSLNTLAPGDAVKLKADNGDELLYTVTESFTVNPDDPNALAVMGPTSSDMVTIITCDGTRYYTGDPVYGHDYTERRVVRASLTSEHIAEAVSAASGG